MIEHDTKQTETTIAVPTLEVGHEICALGMDARNRVFKIEGFAAGMVLLSEQGNKFPTDIEDLMRRETIHSPKGIIVEIQSIRPPLSSLIASESDPNRWVGS